MNTIEEWQRVTGCETPKEVEELLSKMRNRLDRIVMRLDKIIENLDDQTME